MCGIVVVHDPTGPGAALAYQQLFADRLDGVSADLLGRFAAA